MAFKFRLEESAGDGIRRMARGQMDKALGEITDDNLDNHRTVHQVRKRCKKIRALLRLSRGDLDSNGKTYQRENACFRDAARSFSLARDAEALLETCDRLIDPLSLQGQDGALKKVRAALEQRRHAVADDELVLDEKIAAFALTLREARERVDDWPISDGFDALLPGLKKNYRQGRRAMKKAAKKPNSENLHEWRKHVKYHLYHVQVLQPLWSEVLKPWREETKKLGENLGDDHDLTVFSQTLLDEEERFVCNRDLRVLLALSDRRRARLQAQAFPLGQRLFAEKPRHLARRYKAYWDAYHLQSAGQSVG
ncbi:MAG: CHAD domain-containing protein [Chromatocurvus sp.]